MRTLFYSTALALILALPAGYASANTATDTNADTSYNQNQTDQATGEQASSVQLEPSKVRSVQQALNQKGYNTGGVDGQWGQQTAQAVMKFQKANGLQPTGQPDNQTLQALNITPENPGNNQDVNQDTGTGNNGDQDNSGTE